MSEVEVDADFSGKLMEGGLGGFIGKSGDLDVPCGGKVRGSILSCIGAPDGRRKQLYWQIPAASWITCRILLVSADHLLNIGREINPLGLT